MLSIEVYTLRDTFQRIGHPLALGHTALGLHHKYSIVARRLQKCEFGKGQKILRHASVAVEKRNVSKNRQIDLCVLVDVILNGDSGNAYFVITPFQCLGCLRGLGVLTELGMVEPP